MISKELFDKIKKANGEFASWAVWEEAGAKPKSNMGPEKILDPELNPDLLSTLTASVVMVGLNFSRELISPAPLANFHDTYSRAQDYKIRFAFKNTAYWGAYMTDALKGLVEPSASAVRKFLTSNPEVAKTQIKDFETELQFIEAEDPVIIAFGRDSFEVLEKYLNKQRIRRLVKVTHYSHHVAKEKYREDVLGALAEAEKRV